MKTESRMLTPKERADARMQIAREGGNPSGMSDAELQAATQGDAPQGEQGETGQGGQGEQGDAQSEQQGDAPQTEQQIDAPQDEPQPEDNPLDSHIRKIAEQQVQRHRKLDAHNQGGASSTVTVKRTDMPDVKIEGAHHMLPLVLATINAGVNAMLIGPAGAGKTTLSEQVAQALMLPFAMTGAITQSHKLFGFINATGVYVETEFYRVFKNGGLFLFDEQDASNPSVLLEFNAALANGYCDFPCGMVKRHPSFVVIAACNTFGRGADREYVGRAQQDAAALDRFATIVMDYDEAAEFEWAGGSMPKGHKRPSPYSITPREMNADAVNAWVTLVQKYRGAKTASKVRHVISPRASIMGARLLAAGIAQPMVEEMVIWKGLDSATIAKIKAAA
jgi:MoxR-like ATPase